jgi:hypothetical protein
LPKAPPMNDGHSQVEHVAAQDESLKLFEHTDFSLGCMGTSRTG